MNSPHSPLRGPWPPLCSPLSCAGQRWVQSNSLYTPGSLCLYPPQTLRHAALGPISPSLFLEGADFHAYCKGADVHRQRARHHSAAFTGFRSPGWTKITTQTWTQQPHFWPLEPSCAWYPSAPMAPDRPDTPGPEPGPVPSMSSGNTQSPERLRDSPSAAQLLVGGHR